MVSQVFSPEMEIPNSSSDAATAHSHLELLTEMSQDLASGEDLDVSLLKAVDMITDYVHAEGGALFLIDETGDYLDCVACVGPTQIQGLRLNSDQGIVGNSIQTDSGRIVKDVSKDPNFHKGVDEQTGYTTKSILCAPMSVKGERIGAIELINKKNRDGLFDEEDLNLLQVLASSAGLAVLNARMSEALVEQERVKRELELAAEIQRSLLPETAEPDSDFPVRGVNVPARVVSGDFYDFYPLDDGRVAFTLGDVSGKGMNAALMMAKTASLLRCLGKSIKEPGRLLTLVNDEVCETATRGMFVTLVHGIYDPACGHVRLANAGHEPPLILSPDGEFRAIEADAPPLGIAPSLLDEDGFPEVEFQLENGRLFVFTDGVTEGYTADGDELGADGLKKILLEHSSSDVGDVLAHVRDILTVSDMPLRDDITVLAIDDAVVRHEDDAVVHAADPGATEGPSEPLFQMRARAKADRLRLFRNAVRETATVCGFDEKTVADIVLAVDEACQNIIRHAYGSEGEGDISIEVRRRADKMIIRIRDFADPVDIAEIKPRDLDDVRPGGLGTHLIREIMDEVDFLPPPIDGGNLLRLTKKIGERQG